MSLSGCSIVWEMQVPSISPSIFQILLRWMRKGIEVFIVHTWIQLCTKSEVSTWCMELGYLSAFSLEWEDECVVRLNWKKKRSLCSQGVPSETSEMDERIALAKSYTGRSIYTHIFHVAGSDVSSTHRTKCAESMPLGEAVPYWISTTSEMNRFINCISFSFFLFIKNTLLPICRH